MRQDGAGDEEDAADVDGHDPVPQLDRRLVQHADAGDARVVEQDVDPAERGDDVRRQGFGLGRIGHVDREARRPSPARALASISRTVSAAAPLIDVGDGHASALGREQQRRRSPDPGPGAGDEADLAVEPVRHGRAPASASLVPAAPVG